MKFRTAIEIETSAKKIEAKDKIFSVGSCFATEISQRIENAQMQCLNNPFGTIFNPHSIKVELETLEKNKKYTNSDLISYQDEYISLDHHSSFNSSDMTTTLLRINEATESGNAFLKDTQWVVVTYGSAYIYEFLPKEKLVANCHKIPGKFFTKKLLSPKEITDSITETIKIIKRMCRFDVQILFSISPVRHSKDGWIENNLSKSHLITALHEAIREQDNCHYLPIYEIMMDDLRDYRFYKEDMLHPNAQAVHYIFDKFTKAYFSESALDFLQENIKIRQSLLHIPKDQNSVQYIQFRQELQEKIAQQQEKVSHTLFTKKPIK